MQGDNAPENIRLEELLVEFSSGYDNYSNKLDLYQSNVNTAFTELLAALNAH
jgi:hypothetical protein